MQRNQHLTDRLCAKVLNRHIDVEGLTHIGDWGRADSHVDVLVLGKDGLGLRRRFAVQHGLQRAILCRHLEPFFYRAVEAHGDIDVALDKVRVLTV